MDLRKKMSCTILISHYESVAFLRACIRQLKRYEHPGIDQSIIVIDQSSEETYNSITEEFKDVQITHTLPLYSGHGIDYVIRTMDIKTDYICQLHVDAFPISTNWLWLCIKLIKEYGFSFVGQLQFYSRDTDTIYPPGRFFAMAQAFNVARTKTYREMSMEAGFARYHVRPEGGLLYNNDDWDTWALEDYNARGSDDDVVAFAWEDNHRKHDKLGLALTGLMGTGNEPGYGRIIEDIVFHFGFSRESIGVKEYMGDNYNRWTERITHDYSDELIGEMLSIARGNAPGLHPSGTHQRTMWNGRLKTVSNPAEELNKRIEELKHVDNRRDYTVSN